MNNHAACQRAIDAEKEKLYFQEMLSNIQSLRDQGKTIYPPIPDVFNAFKYTPVEKIKAVIIGQDPYHGPNQAHGLCFSVTKGVALPPSLKNIFKAIEHDIAISPPNHGCLTAWAKQGVLLINTILTVEKGQAHSHRKLGWERFTDQVIQAINQHLHRPIAYLLWGNHAIRKSALITNPLHKILTAPHPSPLSAHRGFLTCKHFSQANQWLSQHQVSPINWEVT